MLLIGTALSAGDGGPLTHSLHKQSRLNSTLFLFHATHHQCLHVKSTCVPHLSCVNSSIFEYKRANGRWTTLIFGVFSVVFNNNAAATAKKVS